MRAPSWGLLLSTILVQAACMLPADQPDPPTPFHGDTAFTDSERAVVEDAATIMAQRTGAPRIQITWDGIYSGPRRILREHPPNKDASGEYVWTPEYGHTIYISPEVPLYAPLYFKPVVMHEIGHYYGLKHHKGPGLMAEPSAWDLWNEADIDVCRQAGWCK